jgi:hypothetical protein
VKGEGLGVGLCFDVCGSFEITAGWGKVERFWRKVDLCLEGWCRQGYNSREDSAKLRANKTPRYS